jgi:hypothetical protein
MSHRIRMSLDVACEDDDAAEAEFTWLAEYVAERLNHGADMQRIVQAMVEALLELGEDAGLMAGVNDTIH